MALEFVCIDERPQYMPITWAERLRSKWELFWLRSGFEFDPHNQISIRYWLTWEYWYLRRMGIPRGTAAGLARVYIRSRIELAISRELVNQSCIDLKEVLAARKGS